MASLTASTSSPSVLSFSRVLIGTDDDAAADFLDCNLRKWGYIAQRVRDGDEALRVLSEGDAPRIAILDEEMPLLSGMGVAAGVRSRDRERLVWIILLEEDVDAEKMVDARDAGVDDVLRKPVDPVELRIRVSVAERMQGLLSQLLSQKQIANFHAEHDPLTGLWNRDTMLRRLFAETDRAQRMKNPLALVLIDLDHFARINADHGYDAGDRILKELPKRLRRFLRSYDLLARSGEDEFLVALPGCTSSQARALAKRAKRSILSRPFPAGRHLLTVTASVGISHSEGRSPLVVLREAEQALFAAKQAGRNCERVFAGEEAAAPPEAVSAGTVGAGAVSAGAGSTGPVKTEVVKTGLRLVETLKA